MLAGRLNHIQIRVERQHQLIVQLEFAPGARAGVAGPENKLAASRPQLL